MPSMRQASSRVRPRARRSSIQATISARVRASGGTSSAGRATAVWKPRGKPRSLMRGFPFPVRTGTPFSYLTNEPRLTELKHVR